MMNVSYGNEWGKWVLERKMVETSVENEWWKSKERQCVVNQLCTEEYRWKMPCKSVTGSGCDIIMKCVCVCVWPIWEIVRVKIIYCLTRTRLQLKRLIIRCLWREEEMEWVCWCWQLGLPPEFTSSLLAQHTCCLLTTCLPPPPSLPRFAATSVTNNFVSWYKFGDISNPPISPQL